MALEAQRRDSAERFQQSTDWSGTPAPFVQARRLTDYLYMSRVSR